jgi:hypothetical protein
LAAIPFKSCSPTKFINQEHEEFFKIIKMSHLSTSTTKPTFEQKPQKIKINKITKKISFELILGMVAKW